MLMHPPLGVIKWPRLYNKSEPWIWIQIPWLPKQGAGVVAGDYQPSGPGTPGGSAVERLPSAQGVILGSRDRVPRRGPCRDPASPSACVSASLCVSLP